MTPPPQLSISEVFAGMKKAAEDNRGLLLRITLVFAVLGAASVALELLGGFGIALSYGASLLLGVSYGGMVAAMICLPGRSDDATTLWAQIRPVLARLIWVTLLAGIAVVAGLILFIVPGLILMTIWSVTVPAIVVERLSVVESLERSRELVRGNGWRVFGFLLCLGLVAAVVLMLSVLVTLPLGTGVGARVVSTFLVTLAVNPLTAVGPAALYNALVAPEPTPAPESIDPLAPH